MTSRLPLFGLDGRQVRLEPLDRNHVEQLADAAGVDRSSFGYTMVPHGVHHTAQYVGELLGAREAGGTIPFVQRRLDVAGHPVVGCTRFMTLRRCRRRDAPDEVEIGGTWLAGNAQRTGINAEAKLLMMSHAFEVWDVWRVDFCTDARNTASRAALERIGATFEGVMRNHRPAADSGGERPRDTAVYAVIADEWPEVGARLRQRVRK